MNALSSSKTSPTSSKARRGGAARSRDADLRSLLEALRAVRDGDFRPRFTPASGGILAEVGEVLDQVLDRNRHLTDELNRGRRQMVREGRPDERPALSSRYKSNFLANMSHELRTPLNSLLLLAKLMWANPDGNLSAEQVRFSRTIYEAGRDLLQLINDILDLSKIEAGKMEIHWEEIRLSKLVDYVNMTFRHLAVEQGLEFDITVDAGAPASLFTDEQRLQQIVRNLISNAIKFTGEGPVLLHIAPAGGIVFAKEELRIADQVVAFTFTVTDIAAGKLQMIFDAFQQAGGTTSRKCGETGLGLAICRDIAELLGGEIRAKCDAGKGSTFTLYLPRASALCST